MKLTEFAKGIKADCNHLVKNIHPCTFLTASFLQSKNSFLFGITGIRAGLNTQCETLRTVPRRSRRGC